MRSEFEGNILCSIIQLEGPAGVPGTEGPQTGSSGHRGEEEKSQLGSRQNARIGEDSGENHKLRGKDRV